MYRLVGADYSMVMVTFTFTPTVSVMCEQVNSMEDSILEVTETILLRLSTSDSMVDLNPDMANVNITDNDSKCSVMVAVMICTIREYRLLAYTTCQIVLFIFFSLF